MEMVKGYNEKTVEDIVAGQTDENSGSLRKAKVLEKIVQFFPPVAPIVTTEEISSLVADGVKTFITVAVDKVFKAKTEELEAKANKYGRAAMSLERSINYIILVTMNNAWSDHLQMTEDLKVSVVLRKYQVGSFLSDICIDLSR